MGTLTEDSVGQYLKDNPDFLASWFVDHADDDTLKTLARKLKQDAISVQNSKSPVRQNNFLSVEEKTDSSPTPPTDDSQSIDPSEENKIKKYTTFSKVGRNSITSMIFRKYLDGDRTRRASVKKDLDDLRRMSEEELFMELIRDIASELDVNVLCHKILQNVSILTNSDRGSLFLVRGSRDHKYLVSKLFDVTESSTLEQSIHTEANEIVVPFGVGIAGNVAKSREAINIRDVYADPRFNQEVDKKTGYRTHSILSMPIINYEGEVIGVAQIINKVTGNHEFTKQDEDLFQKYLTFCGIGITNAQLFEMSVNEFKRNQLLLHLARGIFEEQNNLEKLVQKIMLDAQDLLKCEKCSVYLLEDSFERDIMRFTTRFLARLGSYSRTSNLVVAMQDPSNPRTADKKQQHQPEKDRPPPDNPEDVHFSKAFELYAGKIRIPSSEEISGSKNAYIARCTVVEGEPLNIEDLAKDGRFGAGPFKDEHGFVSKSVLCMPIHNSDLTIIGVTQLLNKVNGQPFDDNDDHFLEAFSIFTGLGIHNCQMYENACQLMAKQSVALEVLSYHATASKEEAERIMGSKDIKDIKVQRNNFDKLMEQIPTADAYRLYTYDFDDMAMPDSDTIKATIRMFMDANLISQFKIPYETICRWVCTVKKNYRPVTYHNWRHAFNVCQTMFTMLYTGELRPKFDAVEVFALMTACLCHDLDHRGTNNAFQVKVASPLAMLYSTSVLEHHHFDHCIMIINSEGNNIFQSFTPEEYRRAIKILEHAILSTDLALYFKKRGEFKALVESGEKNFQEDDKKDLLKAMMMTACDVAAITKPWRIQKEIAQLVTSEFFEQGDIEKTQLGEKPIPMMDREKKDELPKMQVDFIDFICTPVYEAFSTMFPRLSPLYEGLMSNRQNWNKMAQNNSLEDPAPKEKLKPPTKSSSGSPYKSSGKGHNHKTNNKTNNVKKAPKSPKALRTPLSPITRKSPLLPKAPKSPPPKTHRARLSPIALRSPLSPNAIGSPLSPIALRSPLSSKDSRTFLTTLKPPVTTRRLSDPPISPVVLRRNFHVAPVTPKLITPLTRDGHATEGRSTNLAHMNGRTPMQGGLISPLFAKISEPLKIFNDGCANNRRHWQELDELHKQGKKWINEETREIGERSQEKQAGDKWDEQGLNKTKQDVSVHSHQVNNTSVKTDTNLLNSQKKDSNLTIICDNNSKIQDRNRTAISNFNVISVNVESKTPPNSSSPAIEDVDVKDQGKSHNVKTGVSKKSSKSSKSHFCLLS